MIVLYINITLTLHCPDCRRTKIKQNGNKHFGKQNRLCENCFRQFIGNHAKQVFIKKHQIIGIHYLIINDLTMKSSHFKHLAKNFWSLEEYHMSIKQNVLIGNFPAHTVRIRGNYVCRVICLFQIGDGKTSQRANLFFCNI
ncbi:hypothetical protein EZS27_021022 [termite gut metagenome]|uniref:InsA N-terminal domain-containing protein n=1 Tax=termite gut metagenome TaxID=433724 RepID=A0A5J4RAU2_9ZZZZ